MILNAAVVLVVLGLGYAYMMRGFFNAFMNMICVVIAGAVAFGLWEFVAHAIFGFAPATGLLSAFRDGAYALGLAIPFGVSLAILRAITDKLVGANVAVGTAADHAGGALCGAVAGVITAGVLAISVGFLRFEPEGQLAVARIDYGAQGNLKRNKGFWLPADKIVAGLYGHMSEASLRTGTPMARWVPNVYEVPWVLRMTGSSKIRNVMKPGDAKLLGRYTLEGAAGAGLETILEDSWNPKPQVVQDLNGDPMPPGSRIEGFVLNFGSGSKESFGQTVVGPTQLRLVTENEAGERKAFHPVAVIAQGEAATTQFGRFRFDSRDVFVGSVGGASDVRMGFDFVVPPGFTPIALYVKNARINLEAEGVPAAVKFTSAAARDGAVRSGSIIGVKAVENLDASEATRVEATGPRDAPPTIDGVNVSNMLRQIIQRGTQGGLTAEGATIRDGMNVFDKKQLPQGNIDRNLQINRFEVLEGTAVVQVDVSLNRASSLLGRAAQGAEMVVPPVLIDTNNQQFEAVGYIYEDGQKFAVRFTPGQPIRGLSELEQQRVMISRARSDQKLTLVFRVSRGVSIRAFALGSKVVAEYDPPVKVDQQQR